MDARIRGWVMENPPVQATLDRLHKDYPAMQVAFVPTEAAEAEGFPANTLVVRATPGGDAIGAVTPDGVLHGEGS